MKKKAKELKKLFISCPTKDRELVNVKNTRARMQKVAEAIFDQELEVINGYPLDMPPFSIDDNAAKLDCYNAGVVMTQIAQADYFVGLYDSIYFDDCNTESEFARRCGVPTTFVSAFDIAKDAVDIAATEMLKNIPMGEEIKLDLDDRPETTVCYCDGDIKIAEFWHDIANKPEKDMK